MTQCVSNMFTTWVALLHMSCLQYRWHNFQLAACVAGCTLNVDMSRVLRPALPRTCARARLIDVLLIVSLKVFVLVRRL